MALDPRYFTSIDLEEYFPSNMTGNPLANGSLWFYQDINRSNPKPVYELSGAPPNYTYTALPNPLPLSAVGTPVDNSGNNIAIYYYPYDINGNLDLYYVVAKDSSGTIQFTRQAWPNITGATNPATADSDITNELTNPQFVEVNFNLSNPMTIAITGSGTTTSSIAPGWDLVTTTTGASNITVQRNAIAGSSAYPSNPPYTLTITPGLNVSGIFLRQRLLNNPDVFSPRTAGTTDGYVSACILLAPSSSVLSIQYQPNGQTAQTIFSPNNTSGIYTQYNATVQLSAASNASTGDTGYVDFIINIPVTGSTTFSNLQLVGLNSNIPTVLFDETTANRQRDQTFNWYEPWLKAKAIPSFLIGWDFNKNPAQATGTTISASSAGANTSSQIWDQTILFQSANNGAAVSRSASGNGSLRITATNTTQFALVQYLPQSDARKILNQSALSVNVAALTNQNAGIAASVGLYYTKGMSLPSTGSNNSIVATLDANGNVATFNGTWFAVPRNGLGPAQFTVGTSSTTNFNDYPLNNWNMAGVSDCNAATFFAIVIGFGSLTAANYVEVDSISLVPGNVATRPGVQSDSEVLQACQYFYSKSFNAGTTPATQAGTTAGIVSSYSTGVTTGGGFYGFPVYMNATPTVTIYNPTNNNAQFYSVSASADCSATTVNYTNQNGFVLTYSAPNNSQNINVGSWSADARLGL